MELKVVQIEKPEMINFVLGQTHFMTWRKNFLRQMGCKV